MTLSRREALVRFHALLAASPLARGQSVYEPERIAPLEELLNADEFEAAARQALGKAVFEHVAAGAGDGRTLRRNREIFEKVVFRPRFLVDVSRLDLSSTLLGRELFCPILAGPSALQGRVHSEAEAAVRRGAAAARTPVVVSERSTLPLERIARAADGDWWYQLAPGSEIETLAPRAADLGAAAIVLTIGAEARPRPDADVHNRLAGPVPAAARAIPDAAGALRRLKRVAKLPVVAKGTMTPADALAAIEAGADAVCVSNLGGRAVDGVPSTLEALPGVVSAVGGRVPVLVDGGFRRGSDALKALAVGAKAVLLGRPVLWALGAHGAAGVQRLFELMQNELALAMGLAGAPNLAAVRPSLVKFDRR